jgi:hypothetical protein
MSRKREGSANTDSVALGQDNPIEKLVDKIKGAFHKKPEKVSDMTGDLGFN